MGVAVFKNRLCFLYLFMALLMLGESTISPPRVGANSDVASAMADPPPDSRWSDNQGAFLC
jgi:hypothetical protein